MILDSSQKHKKLTKLNSRARRLNDAPKSKRPLRIMKPKVVRNIELENKIILQAQRVQETLEYRQLIKAQKIQELKESKVKLEIQKAKETAERKARIKLERDLELENKAKLKTQRVKETLEYKQLIKEQRTRELIENKAKLKAKKVIEKADYKALSLLKRNSELENKTKLKAQKAIEISQAKIKAKRELENQKDIKNREKAENKVKTRNTNLKKSKEKSIIVRKLTKPTTLIKAIIIDLTSQAFAIKDLDVIKSSIIDYIEMGVLNKDIKYLIRFKCVIQIKNIKYIAVKEKVNLEDFITKLASLRNSAHRLMRSYYEYMKINTLIKELQFKCTNMLRIYNYSDVLFSDINFIRDNVLKTVKPIFEQLRPDYTIKLSLSIKRINMVNFTNDDIFIFTNFNDFHDKVVLAKQTVLTLTSSKFKKPYINENKTNYEF